MLFADAALTVVLTLSVIFAGGLALGFWVLFRRGRRQGPTLQASRSGAPVALADPEGAAAKRASVLLVQADDAVRDARDELDFAAAQFGDDQTRAFTIVLNSARARVLEAFELQQRLDDHIPDSAAQRRDWTARIIHLCETAQADLAAELRRFGELRTSERNAPETLAALRRRVDAASARHGAAIGTLAALQRDYSAAAIVSVGDNLARADEELALARAAADDAALAVGPGAGASDSMATSRALEALRGGDEHARRALHLLDSIDALRTRLAEASAALEANASHTRDNIAQATVLRDRATDATAAAGIIAAIGVAEQALASLDGRDPVAGLERLRDANGHLDAAMASARNQEQRLAQAREALAGALVGARSQVSATRDYIEDRRGGIGSEARTRLAEAERLLGVAEAEADPVLALDTARSAATYARDADALARYDLLR